MIGTFSIAVELPTNAPLSSGAFPALSAAVGEITEAAASLWRGFASGRVQLPDGGTIQNRTGEYLRSIELRQLGEFSAEVFSDLAYAHVIEEGAPSRDLKKLLSSSLKVRVTKDGRRYLIIPFRHDSPGSVMGNGMPQSVYQWWQKRSRQNSYVIDGLNYKRRSGTGAYDIHTRGPVMVPARKYHWGTRLDGADLAELGVDKQQAKRLAGMVRFRNPGQGGAKKNSQYITFRVMAEGSKGWIVPAQPGKHPARVTAEKIQPQAEEAFRKAAEADIARAVGGVVEP